MRLTAFEGRWILDRAIEDVRAGQRGAFRGEAQFTADPAGLAYRETGALTVGDRGPFTAERVYRWAEGGDGSIEVRFADGRLFHQFYADEAEPAAAHDCPPDRYRVRYDFARWPRWRAEWRVTGPRKDYVTLTTFRPAGQAGGFGA